MAQTAAPAHIVDLTQTSSDEEVVIVEPSGGTEGGKRAGAGVVAPRASALKVPPVAPPRPSRAAAAGDAQCPLLRQVSCDRKADPFDFDEAHAKAGRLSLKRGMASFEKLAKKRNPGTSPSSGAVHQTDQLKGCDFKAGERGQQQLQTKSIKTLASQACDNVRTGFSNPTATAAPLQLLSSVMLDDTESDDENVPDSEDDDMFHGRVPASENQVLATEARLSCAADANAGVIGEAVTRQTKSTEWPQKDLQGGWSLTWSWEEARPEEKQSPPAIPAQCPTSLHSGVKDSSVSSSRHDMEADKEDRDEDQGQEVHALRASASTSAERKMKKRVSAGSSDDSMTRANAEEADENVAKRRYSADEVEPAKQLSSVPPERESVCSRVAGEGGKEPRERESPSDILLKTLIRSFSSQSSRKPQEAEDIGDGARQLFEFRSWHDQPEPDARARYDAFGMIVDETRLPLTFPSLAQWAKAIKGRAVSVKPYIFFRGKNLRQHEADLAAKKTEPRRNQPMKESARMQAPESIICSHKVSQKKEQGDPKLPCASPHPSGLSYLSGAGSGGYRCSNRGATYDTSHATRAAREARAAADARERARDGIAGKAGRETVETRSGSRSRDRSRDRPADSAGAASRGAASYFATRNLEAGGGEKTSKTCSRDLAQRVSTLEIEAEVRSKSYCRWWKGGGGRKEESRLIKELEE
jgi:hypothetical protein